MTRLLAALAVAVLVPVLARLPGTVITGSDWLKDYLFLLASPLFVGLSLVPGLSWFAIDRLGRKAPSASWWAAAGGLGVLFWLHGDLNLRSNSTASLALLVIPWIASAAVLAAWLVGRVLVAIGIDTAGRRVSVAVIAVAVVIGAAPPTRSLLRRADVLARRPGITVNTLGLDHRVVRSADANGRVMAMAIGNFDGRTGDEVAVLDAAHVTLLTPGAWAVSGEWPVTSAVRSFLLPGAPDTVLLGDDRGVTDRQGQRLWSVDTASFSQVVPLSLKGAAPGFVDLVTNERVEMRDETGRVKWTIPEGANSIGPYETPDGHIQVFTSAGFAGQPNTVKVYDVAGTLVRTLSLPAEGSVVAGISWPARGHWLSTRGGLSVLDPAGVPVMQHALDGLSFAPADGPLAVPVRLRPGDRPLLAVVYGGNSGDPRSVLMLFTVGGQLVYQEEQARVWSIVAAPGLDGTSDTLLLGGDAGVVEYRLRTP